MKKFTFYKQLNAKDCGIACLRMISAYYGKKHNASKLRQDAGYNKEGVSLLGISNAAESIGLRTRGIQVNLKELLNKAPVPCILHWNQNHFVVFLGQKRNSTVTIADPGEGIIDLSSEEFLKKWISMKKDNESDVGTILLLEPTPEFYSQADTKSENLNWVRIFYLLKNSRWNIIKLSVAILTISLFQFATPFLTQRLVDKGINAKDLNFISILLIAQLTLTISRTIVEFIRGRLLMRISINLNYLLVSNFWKKVTSLPMAFFDTFHTGDILQRLRDSKKIETFLTNAAPATIFSFFSLITYTAVLLSYSYLLFLIFFVGSLAYIFWVRLFLRIRRKMNYESFHISAKEYQISQQMVMGMQELKLNNAENLKRWEWENIQTSIFNMQFRNLSVSQKQQAGGLLINEGKNIALTFLAANMVIQGELTFGAMLAVQFIVGQLNAPVEQFISFTQTGQDAKISLERLNEIHNLDEEEELTNGGVSIKKLPDENSLLLQNVSFTYPGAANEPVLKNLNIEIVGGKTTAIVGNSGSGKTTLLKLLLKVYEDYEGDIFVRNSRNVDEQLKLKSISPSFWRSQCGAVLQDGFIFSDSIAKNIAIGFEHFDIEELNKACLVANVKDFIESLPNGYNTNIGSAGIGLSQGQKQRILIARTVYKKPAYLFFDEATNSLDANNEKAIVENLKAFYKGRTVVIVAHRLSTVKNADNIIVLDKGRVIEQGSHSDLIQLKGMYYQLVKNQLELGI